MRENCDDKFYEKRKFHNETWTVDGKTGRQVCKNVYTQ